VATGTGIIVGRVTESGTERPIADAVVVASGPGGRRAVIAESQGRFVFRDLPKGSYTVTALKQGWAEGAYGRLRSGGSGQSIDLADGQQRTDVTIQVWRHGAIAGTIRDENGDPMIGIEVRALLKTFRTGDPRWVPQATGWTDDRGMYRLGNLVPGDYSVVVPSTQMSMFVPQTGAGDLRTTVTTTVGAPVVLPYGNMDTATRSGDYVLVGGVPPAGTPGTGRPFAYRTIFYPYALRSSEGASIPIRSGEERAAIDFTLVPVPTAEVSGIVMNANGPVPNASVQLMSAAPGPGGRIRSVSDILVAMTTSGPGGAFSFPAVPAGQLMLSVSAADTTASANDPNANWLWAKVPLTVAGADIGNLVVTLQDGFTAAGRVVFEGTAAKPTPERLAGMGVSIEALDPRDAQTRGGQIKSDGRFTVNGIPSGEYMLRMRPIPDWHVRSVTIDNRDVTERAIEIVSNVGEIVVTFSDQSSDLQGHVTGSSGPDSTATVLLFPAGGFPLTDIAWTSGSRRFQSIRVDRSGAYAIKGLQPGDYYVVAIPEESAGNWIDAEFLTTLSRSATTIHISEGDKKLQDLRTVVVKR
jgi:hypothetical protein